MPVTSIGRRVKAFAYLKALAVAREADTGLAALFGHLDADMPRAIIGAMDIAMREHLPLDILTLTVSKPMYSQLCELDENSFVNRSGKS